MKYNILLLMPDQHRGDWMPYPQEIRNGMGVERMPLRTPILNRLMEEGVTFLNASTPAPLCAPARACLALGCGYAGCRVKNNDIDMDASQKTFYNVLQENGYQVCGVGKLDLHKASHRWAGENGMTPLIYALGFTQGTDSGGKMDVVNYGRFEERCEPYMRFLAETGWKEQHVADMLGRGKRTDPTPLPDYAYNDNFIASCALREVDRLSAEKPFFMQVNFAGPHAPFDVTKRMRESVAEREFDLPALPGDEMPGNIGALRQNYAAMIENLDRNCSAILNRLEERGLLENTVVIFASDHGEMLGDRGMWAKCVPYQGSVHIPLVVSLPGGRRGVFSRAPVSLEDLAATALELAGAEGAADFPGSVSLLPVLRGEKESVREYTVSSLEDIIIKGRRKYEGFSCIQNGRYKYIRFQSGREELYDLESDPHETQDLSSRLPQITKKLGRILSQSSGSCPDL